MKPILSRAEILHEAALDVKPRCVCGCAEETHTHHRKGSDCGHHGRAVCPKYVPHNRPSQQVTMAQQLAGARSDEQVARNFAALLPYAMASPSAPDVPAVPVPHQRSVLTAQTVEQLRRRSRQAPPPDTRRPR